MRWLLLNQRVDADPEVDPSPPPLVVQPRTLLMPLLHLVVPLILFLLLLHGVLSSVGGLLQPRNLYVLLPPHMLHLLLPPQALLVLKME
jgi:hypothetical protein